MFQFTFDTFAAAVAVVGVGASFAVCRWRIQDLDRRVDKLEGFRDDHGERMGVVETRLTAIEEWLKRIADKLGVS